MVPFLFLMNQIKLNEFEWSIFLMRNTLHLDLMRRVHVEDAASEKNPKGKIPISLLMRRPFILYSMRQRRPPTIHPPYGERKHWTACVA